MILQLFQTYITSTNKHCSNNYRNKRKIYTNRPNSTIDQILQYTCKNRHSTTKHLQNQLENLIKTWSNANELYFKEELERTMLTINITLTKKIDLYSSFLNGLYLKNDGERYFMIVEYTAQEAI